MVIDVTGDKRNRKLITKLSWYINMHEGTLNPPTIKLFKYSLVCLNTIYIYRGVVISELKIKWHLLAFSLDSFYWILVPCKRKKHWVVKLYWWFQFSWYIQCFGKGLIACKEKCFLNQTFRCEAVSYLPFTVKHLECLL